MSHLCRPPLLADGRTCRDVGEIWQCRCGRVFRGVAFADELGHLSTWQQQTTPERARSGDGR